jgi:polyisoprenoid-binding protein YceI
MYDKLISPRINFRLTVLTLKEAPKGKDDPYLMEGKGELAVAGVTNAVTIPVKVMPLADKKMKVSGTVPLKMSDFKIEAPAPKIAMGLIKTGDDVKIIFDWNLAQKAPAAAK